MRRRRALTLLGLALGFGGALALVHLALADTLWARRIELTALDLMARFRGPRAPGPEVALVMIDEATLQAEGSWPLPRRRHAELVEALRRAGARLVAFDVLFTEEEKAPAEALAILERAGLTAEAASLRAHGAGGDEVFAAAIATVPVALPFSFRFEPGEAAPAPLAVAASAYRALRVAASDSELRLAPTGILAPLESLAGAAAALGHVLVFFDVDGAPRFDYPVVAYDLDYYPSLPIRLAQLWLGVPWEEVTVELGRGVRVGPRFVPTDSAMRLLVDYLGPRGTFPIHSYADVLAGKVPDLGGRLVLVGADVIGVQDTFRTPFTSVLPGAERLATVVDSILHDRHLRRGEDAAAAELAAMLVAALAIGLLVAHLPLPAAAAGALGVLVLLDIAAYLAFARGGMWFAAALPNLELLLVFTLLAVWRYALLDRDLRMVRGAFQRYLSPEMVARLAEAPEKLRLGGELREISVLFCDVRGFTGLSEQLDPEALTRIINGFLGPMSEIVLEHGGTVDKYIGDCVMAFWNAPVDQPDHAERACRAALAMQRALSELGRDLPEGAGPLAAGIGINTGPCLVGNFGSRRRFDYSALGDAVNVAARLQELTRSYDAAILVGPETAARVPSLGPRAIDSIQLRGRARPLEIYALDPSG
jgi:adenylate cyclase